MMLRVKGCRVKFLICLLALLILFGGACLKPPALPQWDISLQIPIYRRIVRLGEILSNNDKFRVQPDSSFVFYLDHRLGPVEVGGAVSLIAVEERKKIVLEDFVFSRLGWGRSGITGGDLFGAIPDSGLRLRVEPFSAVFEKQCRLEDVQAVDILDGVVIISVENRTPLNFDTVEIRLLGGIVNSHRLRRGENKEGKIRLGGLTVTNPIVLQIAVSSSGSGQDSITIYPADSLVVNIALESLRIGSGKFRAANARVERRFCLPVAAIHPLRIDSLVLERGRGMFTVGNRLPTAISLSYDLRKIGVSRSRTIEPGAGMTVEFDLAGVGFDNRGKTGGIMELRVGAELDFRGEFVEVTKDCGLDISYVIQDVEPRIVVGMFREPVYIFSRVETIPGLIPFNVRCARFSKAELMLETASYVGFPMDFFITLRAIKDNQVVGSVEDVLFVEPSREGQPVFFVWTKPVTALLNTGPDFITCEYNLRVKGYGRFEIGQSISADAVLNVPVRLAFVPDTVFFPEREVEFTDRERASVQNYLVAGAAGVWLNSALPFGLNGKLVLRPRSTVEPGVLVDSVIIPFSIPAGIVNEQGKCIAGRDTMMSVSLDSNEVTIFRSHALSAGLILEFAETDTVVVYTNDQVKLEAMVELQIRVNNKPK